MDEYHGIIEEAGFLTEDTKKEALSKLEAMNKHVLYPDDWRPYGCGDLEIKPLEEAGTFWDAYIALERYDRLTSIEEYRHPVDKELWSSAPVSAPFSTNCTYDPDTNSIYICGAYTKTKYSKDMSKQENRYRMKILLVPMAAMAETSGPSGRCRLLAEGFREAGFEIATCRAEDVNYKAIEGIYNYHLETPMPFGLPRAIASRTFPIAQKLGITSRKTVSSFDEVLWFTGNLDYRYLEKSVASVRKAIWDFSPDAVYSEFNISAIIASKIEQIPLYATVSYPTQHEYANRPELAKGINRLFAGFGMQETDSALRLFDWADKAFCPSIRKLEPIDKPNVYYCGALRSVSGKASTSERNKILVYMGSGTVSPARESKVIKEAFSGSEYQVYIASASLKEADEDNIHIAGYWDFESMLDEAFLFINHGGQNSIVDGLLHKVPQIMVPGKVFERKYNAGSVEENKAGIAVSEKNFIPAYIRDTAERVIRSEKMSANAAALGKELTEAGGIRIITEEILRGPAKNR